jgi:hypothetical protein
MTIVVDHLIHHIASNENAKPSRPQTLQSAHVFMPKWVAFRVQNSSVLEEFNAEARARILYSVKDEPRRAQITNLNTLAGIVLSAVLYRVAEHLAKGIRDILTRFPRQIGFQLGHQSL